ncbi:MAG: YabP/YqfC family sporulation protein [Bacillota bacterium]
MEKLKKQFVEIFEISPEIALDLPLLMLMGEEKLLIENHKGINQFHHNEIKIKLKKGYLLVKGEKLNIEEINIDYISISGTVSALLYDKGKRGESS